MIIRQMDLSSLVSIRASGMYHRRTYNATRTYQADKGHPMHYSMGSPA